MPDIKSISIPSTTRFFLCPYRDILERVLRYVMYFFLPHEDPFCASWVIFICQRTCQRCPLLLYLPCLSRFLHTPSTHTLLHTLGFLLECHVFCSALVCMP